MIIGRAALALGAILLLGERTQTERIGFIGVSETARDVGVNLLTTSSTDTKGRATGAIRYKTAAGWHASCGATFISPHFAITAGHCVAAEYLAIERTPFAIEQYDTTQLDLDALRAQAHVAGVWPDFHRPRRLDARDGYHVQRIEDCVVTRRNVDADIALLRCPSRASTDWVRVATSDDGRGAVEVRWFYELLNLSITGEDRPDQPRDNWQHYGLFTEPAALQNYHYFHSAADRDHQLLPLQSTHTAGGVAYRRTGDFGSRTNYFTNVPVCHGTSGSGVFIAGTDDFLGPIAAGRFTRTLCDVLNDPAPSRMASGYPRRIYSARLEALPEVQRDRLSLRTH